MLRKALKIIGGFFLVIGALITVIFGYFGYLAHRNSNESEAFARESMVAISKDWQAKELLDRYSPDAKKKMNTAKLAANMETLKEWGGLQNLGNLEGLMPLSGSIGNDPEAIAVYRGELMLEKGKALMRLRISKVEGKWSIDRIDICNADSKAAEECSLYRKESEGSI
jgi:hypothetical protein